jgi:hypothetical protein
MIRLTHVLDPDTGGVGRDARVAGVSYDHSKRQAVISLDNTDTRFDALLSRFAAISAT